MGLRAVCWDSKRRPHVFSFLEIQDDGSRRHENFYLFSNAGTLVKKNEREDRDKEVDIENDAS
jgi:hypothetical protein